MQRCAILARAAAPVVDGTLDASYGSALAVQAAPTGFGDANPPGSLGGSELDAGYANYGRNRARSLFYEGEIYELYLRPEFQGLGFGRRLFTAAWKDLGQSGLKSLVVWALSDNEPAVEFYRALGGKAVARSSERFGVKSLDKVAFAWRA